MLYSGRTLLTLTMCLALGACAFPGSKHTTAPVTPGGSVESGRGIWYCQANAAWDDWDCGQDPRLALNPLPARSPGPPQPVPEPAMSVPLHDAADVPGSKPLQVAMAPAPADLTVSGQRANTDAAPAEPAALSANNPRPAEAPDWQHLAYRPAAVIPLNELPARFYAVQIVSMTNMEALESFRREHRLSGVLGARVEAGGKIYYALLLGVYETRADAQAAAASRPVSLQRIEPWIRKLGSLQEAVARADVLAASAGN